MRFLIVFLSMMFCVELCAYQSRVESVVVKTRAPSNKVVTFSSGDAIPRVRRKSPASSAGRNGRMNTKFSWSLPDSRTTTTGSQRRGRVPLL